MYFKLKGYHFLLENQKPAVQLFFFKTFEVTTQHQLTINLRQNADSCFKLTIKVTLTYVKAICRGHHYITMATDCVCPSRFFPVIGKLFHQSCKFLMSERQLSYFMFMQSSKYTLVYIIQMKLNTSISYQHLKYSRTIYC